MLVEHEAHILAHREGVEERPILEDHAHFKSGRRLRIIVEQSLPRLPKHIDSSLQFMYKRVTMHLMLIL